MPPYLNEKKKILLISFGSEADIICLAPLINKLKEKYEDSKIDILTYTHQLPATKTLKSLDAIHSIDARKIKHLLPNQLVEDTTPLNFFMSEINAILETNWSEIVNCSTNRLSKIFAGMLSTQELKGSSLSKNRLTQYHDEWSILLTSPHQLNSHTPFTYTEILHHMCDVPLEIGSIQCRIDPINNELAYKNIRKIRSSEERSDTKIIAIRITGNKKSENLDYKFIETLVQTLGQDPSFSYLFITGPKDHDEHILINKLNKNLGKKIITVKADYVGAASVLVNIDLLITPPSPLLSLADQTQTSVIQIEKADNSSYFHSSNQCNNLIIKLNFSSDEEYHYLLLARDLLKSIKFHFEPAEGLASLSTSSQLYRIKDTSFGQIRLGMHSNAMSTESFRDLFRKIYLTDIINGPQAKNIKSLISLYSPKDISDFLEREKKYLLQSLKYLLSCLKSLEEMRIDSSKSNFFIESLDQLLTIEYYNATCSLPALIFRKKIDSIQSKDISGNINSTKKILYELKEHFKSLSQLIEQSFNEIKIDEVQQKDHLNAEGLL